MTILDPLHYEFFIRGLLAATMVGALCGLVGVYVVLRRMSYIGHGLSHAVFGGAVVSYIVQINFYVGAGLWGFLAALLITATGRRRRIGADAAIGIVTTASFAFGVALISRVRKFTTNFEAALFGNVLGVSGDDLTVIAVVGLAVAVLVFFSYKQLLFLTFDPEVARIYGISTGRLDAVFALALAAAIIASLQVMGVTLIAAALVIPAATARMLTDSFNRMVGLSVGLGAATGAVGIYLSFFTDISSGATIVLVAATTFTLASGYAPLRRLLAGRAGERRSLPAAVQREGMSE